MMPRAAPAGRRRPAPEAGIRPRAMTTADLDRVMAVERRAYPHPWTRGNFIDSLAAGYLTELWLDAHGGLLGYWVAMPGCAEMHLLNLTVEPAAQRQGHGRAMLERLCAQARARGDHTLWLEVRAGNAPARALYAAAGFAMVGCRKGYYPGPEGQREDALVMSLPLQGAGDAVD